MTGVRMGCSLEQIMNLHWGIERIVIETIQRCPKVMLTIELNWWMLASQAAAETQLAILFSQNCRENRDTVILDSR